MLLALRLGEPIAFSEQALSFRVFSDDGCDDDDYEDDYRIVIRVQSL
jgi:hypothetical protein